jgi:hypothetical protein
MRHDPRGWLAAGGLAAALLLPASGAAAQSVGADRAGAAAAGARESARVTLSLRDTPLRMALEMLFEGTGLQYAVEPTVPNFPISLRLRDVPFQTALRTLLRLAPGVTFQKDGDVFVVKPRQPAPEVASYPAELLTPPEGIEIAAVQAEKIPLKYLHPAVLHAVLGGQLVPTEDQILSGLGSLGGALGNLGGYQGGATGLNGGAAGFPGGGLGPTGGFPGVNGTGLSPGTGTGSVSPYVNFGSPQGTGSGLLYDRQGNGVIVAPRWGRRF